MRTQIELSNEVAAELAGSQDAVLRALEAHLSCKVFLRGNLLTLDGSVQQTSTLEMDVLIDTGDDNGSCHFLVPN